MHWHSSLGIATIMLVAAAGSAEAQNVEESSLQSPRQALMEMFSGSQDKFNRHLTLEMQPKMADLERNSAPNSSSQWLLFLSGKTAGVGQKFESFDSGRILFAINDAQRHHRYELQLDSDDWRGDVDTMQISLHSFQAGIEESSPVHLRVIVEMKLVDSIWRLNNVELSTTMAFTDPRILESSWWLPQIPGTSSGATENHEEKSFASHPPPLSPLRAVHRIALAENLYAQHHPDVGYTCAIANLVDVGKGLDENGAYRFLSPEFAAGLYNGYRFGIRGCEGTPAKNFEIVAEPANGTGKAYCSDRSHTLRSSDDGRGLTCLAIGRITRQ